MKSISGDERTKGKSSYLEMYHNTGAKKGQDKKTTEPIPGKTIGRWPKYNFIDYLTTLTVEIVRRESDIRAQ